MNRSPPDSRLERVACPDCGLTQVIPGGEGLTGAGPHDSRNRHTRVVECCRCGCVLAGPATGRVDAPLALCVAALLLLLPALAAPIMTVSTFGAERSTWMPSTAAGLWTDGFMSLGLLVAAFGIALPAAFLGLLIWVLGHLHFLAGRAPPAPRGPGRLWLGPAFRWAKRLRPWVMIEVFLVGCFVAYSRIKVIATVEVGLGGWCLIAATLILLLALTQLDERTVWQALEPHDAAAGGSGIACTVCDLVVHRDASAAGCPRCGAALHARKPDSMRRTAALVAAGYLLYVPANTLPVLSILRFGREDTNTILSGVLELIHNDLWPLAAIVFVASIVLPLLKLCGLTWMMVATRQGSSAFLVGRTRFYRTIDLVGRWSNIDVFMASVLIALLQFGTLTSVHAGDGLVAFASVVILTMLATEAFDTRLMWDACTGSEHG